MGLLRFVDKNIVAVNVLCDGDLKESLVERNGNYITYIYETPDADIEIVVLESEVNNESKEIN